MKGSFLRGLRVLRIALILFLRASHAEAGDLTLDEAVFQTIEHDSQVAIAQAHLKKLQATPIERPSAIPNVSLHSGYSPLAGREFVGVSVSVDLDRLIRGDNTKFKRSLKEFDVEIAKLELKQAQDNAARGAIDAYLSQKHLKALAASREAFLKTQSQSLDQVKEEVGSGNLNPERLETKERTLAQAQWEKEEAELNLERAKILLDLQTGKFPPNQKDGGAKP